MKKFINGLATALLFGAWCYWIVILVDSTGDAIMLFFPLAFVSWFLGFIMAATAGKKQ